MPSPLQDRLYTLLSETPGTLHLINVSAPVLRTFINAAATHEILPTIRIFAPQNTFDTLAESFITAAKANALTTNHNIELRVGELDAPPTLVYDNTVIAAIQNHLLEDTNPALASELHNLISTQWETTTPYTFTHPSLSTIYDSLATHLSPETAMTTQSLVKNTTEIAPNTSISISHLVMLAAAQEHHPFTAVVNWAETINLTTRGDLSRIRQHLETHNLITTTTEQSGNGRPKIILHPSNTDTDSIDTHLEQLLKE